MTDIPWPLTPRQIEMLDLLCELGSQKAVARAMGISHKTVATQMDCARAAMGGATTVPTLLKWDRWRRQAEGAAC